MTAGNLMRTYRVGDIILRQDEPVEGMFVIQEGEVEVLHRRDGEEVRLSVLGQRDFFGEVPLFERVRSPGTARATVRALGEVQVLVVGREMIAQRLHEDPSLAFRILELMSRRIHELEPAFWTTYFMASMSNLDELLSVIIREATSVTDAVSCSLALYDPDAGELLFHVARGEGKESAVERRLKQIHLPMGKGILGWCAAQLQSAIVNDAYADPRFDPEVDQITGFTTRSVLAVPMVRQDRLIGVVEVVNKKDEEPFTEHDEQLLALLAAQAALVLENARLYEENLRQVRLAALGQGIAGAAHCIKNILNGMEGGGYMVGAGLKRQDLDRAARGWEILQRNSGIMKDLVLDMLAYSRPREPEYAPSDPNEICARVAALMEEKGREKNAAIELDLQPDIGLVVLDPQGIYRCLLNLVGNAVDACDKAAGKVRIATRRLDGEERLRVQVSDNGCGIGKEHLPDLFKVFFSTKGNKGTGLGLAVTQKIIHEHGGRIAVESEPGLGTTFTIELPLRP